MRNSAQPFRSINFIRALQIERSKLTDALRFCGTRYPRTRAPADDAEEYQKFNAIRKWKPGLSVFKSRWHRNELRPILLTFH